MKGSLISKYIVIFVTENDHLLILLRVWMPSSVLNAYIHSPNLHYSSIVIISFIRWRRNEESLSSLFKAGHEAITGITEIQTQVWDYHVNHEKEFRFLMPRALVKSQNSSWQGRERRGYSLNIPNLQAPYLQEWQTLWATITMVLVGMKSHYVCF